MSNNVLIEAFGSITQENHQSDGVDTEAVIEAGVRELDEHPLLSLDDIDTFITGMDADVTEALQTVLEDSDYDIDVQPFYPNVKDIQEEDDISYQQAWQNGYTWRNNRVFVNDEEDEQQDLVTAAVRLGDAGDSGAELLRHARRKSVLAIDINLDSMVDRDSAYNNDDAEAEADSDSDAGVEAEA